MKLDAALIDKDAHKEFRRFLKNTGQAAWEKKIAKINMLPALPDPSPNSYRRYLANRNPLTNDIAAFLKIDREGKLFRKHATEQLMKTAWYLKIANALFSQMPAQMSEKIRSILLDDETVRSFLFELDIATHFFRRSVDIKFVDLENLGTFDLLVSDGQVDLEIECKTKSADAGRKITRANFYLLCDVLAADLGPLTESFAVIFKCNGRLNGSQQLFHEAAGEIARCRAIHQNQGAVDGLEFEIITLPSGREIRTQEDAAVALAPYRSIGGHTHYSVLSGTQTMIVACESTDNDRVLKAIYEDLKHGAGQLSGTRAAILACQLEDIYDEDWSKLQGETGLAAMSNRLLEGSNRTHINYVVYSSNKTPSKTEAGVTAFSSTTLRFQNRNAKYSLPAMFLGVNNNQTG